MRKILVVSVALNAALAAALYWKELTAHAAGGVGALTGNGDVNDDGQMDISDPVYLLNWLFAGGPAPVPMPLPHTGETKCFDNQNGNVDCDSPEFPGQLSPGCGIVGRFVPNPCNDCTVVTDSCTGLMWQVETAIGTFTWQDALKYCDSLELAGYTDWRLPNVNELLSIIDYGRWNPGMDSIKQLEGVDLETESWYWSSTTSHFPGEAYDVNLGHASYGDTTKSGKWHVRAVRTIQPGE